MVWKFSIMEISKHYICIRYLITFEFDRSSSFYYKGSNLVILKTCYSVSEICIYENELLAKLNVPNCL